MNKNELRVFNLKASTINGGSMRYFICHKDSKYKNNNKKINKILREEMKSKLDKPNTFSDFFKLINVQKKKIIKIN